jgi:hypothetical protein
MEPIERGLIVAQLTCCEGKGDCTSPKSRNAPRSGAAVGRRPQRACLALLVPGLGHLLQFCDKLLKVLARPQ